MAADSAELINVDLIALVQLTHHGGAGGTGGITDIHAGMGNRTGSQYRFAAAGAGTAAGVAGARILHTAGAQDRIVQAEPAVADPSPLVALDGSDFIDIHTGAVGQLANHSGTHGAGFIAYIDVGAALDDGSCHNGFPAAGAFLLRVFLLLGIHQSLVVGIIQGDPAAAEPAPEGIVDGGGFKNHNRIPHVQLADGGGAGSAGCIADIDVGIGDLHLNTPHGIQGLTGIGGGQGGNLGAVASGGVPAGKLQRGVGMGGICLDGNRGIGIKALHLILAHGTAVGIIDYICIVGRRLGGALAVEVQICLCQAALDQTGAGYTGRIGPQGNGIEELIAGGAVENRSAELACASGPGGTAIEREGNQRIKLSLVQSQIIVGSKFVDAGFQGLHMLAHDPVGFLSGNGGTFFTGSAETNGPLTVVHVGIGVEALKALDHQNRIFRGGHLCGKRRQSSHRRHSDQHYQNQHKAE